MRAVYAGVMVAGIALEGSAEAQIGISDSAGVRIVQLGDPMAAPRSLGIRWTPAIVINGVLLGSTPDSASLYRLVEAALRKPRLLLGGTKTRQH
jgi:hypothetical protein